MNRKQVFLTGLSNSNSLSSTRHFGNAGTVRFEIEILEKMNQEQRSGCTGVMIGVLAFWLVVGLMVII